MTTGSRLMAGTALAALLAAIRRSPIVVQVAVFVPRAAEWARIRRSPEVDAYVLAWIASHARGARRAPHTLM